MTASYKEEFIINDPLYLQAVLTARLAQHWPISTQHAKQLILDAEWAPNPNDPSDICVYLPKNVYKYKIQHPVDELHVKIHQPKDAEFHQRIIQIDAPEYLHVLPTSMRHIRINLKDLSIQHTHNKPLKEHKHVIQNDLSYFFKYTNDFSMNQGKVLDRTLNRNVKYYSSIYAAPTHHKRIIQSLNCNNKNTP